MRATALGHATGSEIPGLRLENKREPLPPSVGGLPEIPHPAANDVGAAEANALVSACRVEHCDLSLAAGQNANPQLLSMKRVRASNPTAKGSPG